MFPTQDQLIALVIKYWVHRSSHPLLLTHTNHVAWSGMVLRGFYLFPMPFYRPLSFLCLPV